MGGAAPPPASGAKKDTGPVDPGPTSLFLFTPSSPVRRLTTWFVNWPLFEWTIIITIIANCVVMALDDKLPAGDKTVLSIQMVSQMRGRSANTATYMISMPAIFKPFSASLPVIYILPLSNLSIFPPFLPKLRGAFYLKNLNISSATAAS